MLSSAMKAATNQTPYFDTNSANFLRLPQRSIPSDCSIGCRPLSLSLGGCCRPMRYERDPASVPAPPQACPSSLGCKSPQHLRDLSCVAPYLLRSGFGHDGLWIFADRILTDWSRQREGCILRGESASAARSTTNNPAVLSTARNAAMLSTAKNAVVTSIMIFITPSPCLPKPSDERPRTPLFGLSGRAFSTTAYF
jgi:hypothetical protein